MTEKGRVKVSMQYLGDLSAVDPVYTRRMTCEHCNVSWDGCWDAFECPQCGDGELPNSDLSLKVDLNTTYLLENLRAVYDTCEKLNALMDVALAESAEKTAGLRNLREARDCFLRALLEKK